MKKGDYFAAKQEKKKSTNQAVVVLVVFIIVFIFVIFRLAFRPGTNQSFFSLMPTGAEAYKISTTFVRPTIKTSGDVVFSDNDFQYSVNPDSVYVIKSFYTIEGGGQSSKTNFTVTLKYNGGTSSDGRDWTMIDLQDDK